MREVCCLLVVVIGEVDFLSSFLGVLLLTQICTRRRARLSIEHNAACKGKVRTYAISHIVVMIAGG